MQAFLTFLRDSLGLGAPPLVKPDPFIDSHKAGTRQWVAVRDGYKITEVPSATPSAPSRGHTFEDVPSFAGFLLRHFPPDTTEILATAKSIVAASAAIFERDTVTCALAKDPAFLAWVGKDGTALYQKDLYRFLNGRREEIRDAGATAAGGTAAVLLALRTLEVKFAGNAKMTLTESGGVSFTGAAKGVEVEGVMPAGFKVEIPVYVGQPEKFTLDVDLVPELTEGKPAAFTIVLRNLDFVKNEAFEGELGKLRTLLKCGENPADRASFLVSRGTLSLA